MVSLREKDHIMAVQIMPHKTEMGLSSGKIELIYYQGLYRLLGKFNSFYKRFQQRLIFFLEIETILA
jgi:hypothetical protein